VEVANTLAYYDIAAITAIKKEKSLHYRLLVSNGMPLTTLPRNVNITIIKS
jgi:hypothetical protein